MANRIPYGKQWIDDEDIAAVCECLRGDWLTQGPHVAEFEAALAEYAGARYAVTFANGTAALHGAYFAAGLGPGDEVVTSPITFAATANAALYVGATPVFADVDPCTSNLDVAAARAAITPRTRALVPVDFAGHPADLDGFRELADRHGILIIEDAAHALSAVYRGRRVGSLADMTMFSFHPVKPITTGEGGAILTNRTDLYQRLLRFRSHGIEKSPALLQHEPDGPWYHEMQDLGYNYRLTDLQAVLGRSQLRKLDRFTSRRREIAGRYSAAFADLTGVRVPVELPDCQSAWHLYVLKVDWGRLGLTRAAAVAELAGAGVGTQVHYIPVYRHPYYQAHGYANLVLPAAEAHYRRSLTLPLFPAMDDSQVEQVIDAVCRCLTPAVVR